MAELLVCESGMTANQGGSSDAQLGQRLFECHKLIKELENVETCLLYFRDELPVQLLVYEAGGLLGLNREVPEYHFQGDPLPPYAGTEQSLQDARDYLQVPVTRRLFLKQWSEEKNGFLARSANFTLQLCLAKSTLNIPNDPWATFPKGVGIVVKLTHEEKEKGWTQDSVSHGVVNWATTNEWGRRIELVRDPTFKLKDWEYVVGHLVQRQLRLQTEIGARMRGGTQSR
jgi:hypothetical protein